MRCQLCDYSDTEARSIYHSSLVAPKGSGPKRVWYEPALGFEVCNICAKSILSTEDLKHA